MAFIYDCEFKIHSVIDNLTDAGLPDGEPEINIITAPGFLKYDRATGALTVSYSENVEGGDKVLSELTLLGDTATLSKRGAIRCDITFREGEEHKTLYTVSPYTFDMTVHTKRLRTTLTKEGGELSLIYSMNIGGGEKSVRMKIVATRKK